MVDGPGFEDPVEFEPQVVVQMRSRMLLDDETQLLRLLDCGLAAWLGRLGEIAFRAVLREQLLRPYSTSRHSEQKVPAVR